MRVNESKPLVFLHFKLPNEMLKVKKTVHRKGRCEIFQGTQISIIACLFRFAELFACVTFRISLFAEVFTFFTFTMNYSIPQ